MSKIKMLVKKDFVKIFILIGDFKSITVQVSPLSRDVFSLRTLFLQLLTKSLGLTIFCKTIWTLFCKSKNSFFNSQRCFYRYSVIRICCKILFFEQLKANQSSVMWFFYHVKMFWRVKKDFKLRYHSARHIKLFWQ